MYNEPADLALQDLHEVREHGWETRPAARVDRGSAEQNGKNEAMCNAIAAEFDSRGRESTSRTGTAGTWTDV